MEAEDSHFVFEAEPTMAEPKKERNLRKGWADLVTGVRDRYDVWKKGLVERTDAKLIETTERYQGEWREESPQTMFAKVDHAMRAAYLSLDLKSVAELGVRAVLPVAEFSAQMAAKQFLLDIAIRQADCDKLAAKYERNGGAQAVEAEAMQFANEVRSYFDELKKVSERMIPEGDHDREAFRQRHIQHGKQYAEQLLQKTTIIPAERRAEIVADIERYLDTELFDTNRSSILRGYDKLSKRWKHSIQEIMERHIDVYQKKKARNLAVLTTASRWLTFGTETFLVTKALSAYGTVSANYDKVLQQVPAHERDASVRLKSMAEGVRTSFKQLVMQDRFDVMLQQHKLATGVEALITPETAMALDQDFNVDKIANAIWEQFSEQLTKRGVSEAEMYDRIEDLAAFRGDRRMALRKLLRGQLLGLHRETIKATTQQVGYAFQQVNSNIMTLGALQHIDQSIDHVLQVRASISASLSQLEAAPTIVTQVAVAEQTVHIPIPDMVHPGTADPNVHTPFADGEEIPPENTVSNVHNVVETGDTAWKIVSDHLEWYRAREGNAELTIPQAVALLEHDNHLTDAAKLSIGEPLTIPGQALPADDAPVTPASEGLWEQDKTMTPEMALQAARAIDHHYADDRYVTGATRHDLHTLPPNEYIVVFGDRYSARDGSMPVHYGSTYAVHVDATGAVLAKPLGDSTTEPIPLTTLLDQERAPIAKVFTTEPNELHIDHGQTEPETWSVYNQNQIRHLQDHAIKVLDKEGTYCAKDMAERFNVFDPNLAAAIGVELLDAEGQPTGVTVPAPMVAEAIRSAGGSELATLSAYYRMDSTGSHPLETLNSDNPVYRYAVQQWVQAAAKHPLEIGTFLYNGTKIQDIIAANRAIGGEANSHVVTLLGEKDTTVDIIAPTDIERVLLWRYGLTRSDLAERGYLFESLGIEVNGEKVTDGVDWLKQPLKTDDVVVIHDVALNHHFHGASADGLVALMVRRNDLNPVSVLEPNPEAINAALADHSKFGDDFMVDSFTRVESGMTFQQVLQGSGLAPDVWQAAELTLAERGVDTSHIEPGDIIPIFNEQSLRENLELIYERAEAREAIASGTEVHIVRPHESMDHITEHFFERQRYSTTEWGILRDEVARSTGIPFGDKTMPGDVYTKPYSVHEYHVQADAVLSIDTNALATMEQSIWRQRAAEQVYIPTELPIVVEAEGIVMTPFPAEVIRLIDTVIDGNPEYGEDVRLALALVYANEGMRETADKNALSTALVWVNEHLPNRNATVDQLIAYSEYYSSRQMQKDFAWSIQDTPWAKASLDFAIAQLRLQPDLPPVLLATLEKAAGVSSAGLFQVRANNFVEADDSRFTDFEQELRADPLLNTAAAAKILHQNERAFDTYLTAFGDPHSNDEAAKLLALVNSYNGGPYKTMLGSLQERLLHYAQTEHVTIPLDQASGRGTDVTREALLVVCEQLRTEGKLHVSNDQLQRDLAMLGTETVGFLRSDTMQQLKIAYRDTTGQDLSLLPNQEHLTDSNVSYGNYGLLATRGGAYDLIQNFSQATRLAKGEDLPTIMARDDSPLRSVNKG